MEKYRVGDSLEFVVTELGCKPKTVAGCVVDNSSSGITILVFEMSIHEPTDFHPTVFKLTNKTMLLAQTTYCNYTFTSTQLCVFFVDLFTDVKVIHTKNASNVVGMVRDQYSQAYAHCFSATFLEKKNRNNYVYLDALMTETMGEAHGNHLYGRMPFSQSMNHALRDADGIGSQFYTSAVVNPAFFKYVLCECRKLDAATCTIERRNKSTCHHSIQDTSLVRQGVLQPLVIITITAPLKFIVHLFGEEAVLAVSKNVTGDDRELHGKTMYRLMASGEGDQNAPTGILTLNLTTSTMSFDGRSKSEKVDDVVAARKGTKNDFVVIMDHEARQLYPVVRVGTTVVALIAVVSMTTAIKPTKSKPKKGGKAGEAGEAGAAGAMVVEEDPGSNRGKPTKKELHARKVQENIVALVVVLDSNFNTPRPAYSIDESYPQLSDESTVGVYRIPIDTFTAAESVHPIVGMNIPATGLRRTLYLVRPTTNNDALCVLQQFILPSAKFNSVEGFHAHFLSYVKMYAPWLKPSIVVECCFVLGLAQIDCEDKKIWIDEFVHNVMSAVEIWYPKTINDLLLVEFPSYLAYNDKVLLFSSKTGWRKEPSSLRKGP